MRVHSFPQSQHNKLITNFLESISCMAVSEDSKLIVVACGDGSIKVYDFQNRRELHHLKDIHFDVEPVNELSKTKREISSLALSRDLKLIVFVTENGINVFDLQKGGKCYCLKSSEHGN